MNRILVLSREASDLEALILENCPGAGVIRYAGKDIPEVENWDALAILGGTEEAPMHLCAGLRDRIEEMRLAGRRIFIEYGKAIGNEYQLDITEMTHHRLVSGENAFLPRGALLDGHWNRCIRYAKDRGAGKALLAYHDYICAHDWVEMSPEVYQKGRRALWLHEGNTLICAFQLCNFRKARLAPEESWQQVLRWILTFLAEEPVAPVFAEPVCRYEAVEVTRYRDVEETVARGLSWFREAGILLEDGREGVLEGLSHLIRSWDGYQKPAPEVRTDCCGEVGGAWLLDAMLTGSAHSRQRFEALEDFCFDKMQVKTGLHKGMLRWSETCWHVCYQDDVARAILPTLLCQNFTLRGSRHFADAVEACRYLLKSTGENGLRVSWTDSSYLTEEKMAQLRAENSGTTRAHHNGYYAAVLLLCYRAGGPKEFLEMGEKALQTIMELYPNNEREHSQTQELCRLVFPLAVLYEITGDDRHRQWLDLVWEELEKVRHGSGGYREWDTGYKANRARREADECSLLACNGDPVADLLYSVNWLPLGFAYGYLATGDAKFLESWRGIASFMASCQTRSRDPQLNGAWARAFDMDRREVYGVPHDIGWAPCCVESGWTVAEILMGLQFMGLMEAGKVKKLVTAEKIR